MKDLAKIADQWVRANRRKLISKFCSDIYETQDTQVTIFMAGTPGAGKTEFSLKLIDLFDHSMVRIDADEIRELMRVVGYTGANAQEFQHAASKGVNILYDRVLSKGYSAVIDGTFAYENWRENIERSLQRQRVVEIYYLYQDPIIAWDFVKKRERRQGRAVPLDVFIESYEKSIVNVERAIEVFGDSILVYFAKNNYTKNVEYIKVDVSSVEELMPVRYTRVELKEILNARKNS
jgi:predicted ABC-type ATPase